MNSIIVQTGELLVNTYILHQHDSKETVIVDPGGSYEKIKSTLDEYDLNPKAILLTHGHFDHIGAVKKLKADYDVDVYIHSDDAGLMTDAKANLSAFFSWSPCVSVPADFLLTDGQVLTIADMTFRVIHTPGHSMGSVVFVTENAAFTGDTVFRMAIGRTDFLGSNEAMMRESLVRVRKEIAPELLIFPGHGEASAFSYELENNPYLVGEK